MANNDTQATEGTKQTPSAEGSGERTFTQEEVNRLVGQARQKERSKYEGYVSAEEANETATRAQKAEAELERLRVEAERAKIVSQVASESGMPSDVISMLNGKDAAELAVQAGRIKQTLLQAPTRTDDGGGRTVAKKSIEDRFADNLGI